MQVVLTDCEEAVLSNLRECAAANAKPRQAPGHSAQAAALPLQVRPVKALSCPADSLIVCGVSSVVVLASGRATASCRLNGAALYRLCMEPSDNSAQAATDTTSILNEVALTSFVGIPLLVLCNTYLPLRQFGTLNIPAQCGVCVQRHCAVQESAEDLDFDPEDADICDSLDDFLEQATSSRCKPASGPDGHEEHLEWDFVSPKPFGAMVTN